MDNLICKILDEDIGEKSKELVNPRVRWGARGIVIRDDGKIAIFNKANKNEYKLPGGGIDEGESPEEGFIREVLEETGCEIEIMQKLGIAEEYKTLDNFMQISHVFLGKVIKDTGNLHMTQKEIDEGGRLLWLDVNEALEKIIDAYDKLIPSKYEMIYYMKFINLRDRKILEYYIENKQNR